MPTVQVRASENDATTDSNLPRLILGHAHIRN